jgi:transposase
MTANKTDANDADGLAHLAEVGFYKEVRVKSFDSMLARTLVAARTRLVRIGTELSNQIAGLMKTFGLVVPPVSGSKFEHQVQTLLADNADLGRIIRPLLEAWHAVRLRPQSWAQAAGRCAAQRRLPAAHDHPRRRRRDRHLFRHRDQGSDQLQTLRSVGAWVGLTTRRYQSGGDRL